MTSERHLTIDSLRGLAIVLMLFQHMPSYLVEGVNQTVWYACIWWIARFSAPLFFLIAGYCVYLSYKKRFPVHKRLGFTRYIAYRSMILFLLGILVNLFRYQNPFEFNVLHCISISLLITCGVLLVESKRIYLLILLILIFYSFIEPLIRPQTAISSIADIPSWLFTSGIFPIMSWNIYFIIGLGLGWFRVDKYVDMKKCAFVGAGLLVLSIVLLMIGFKLIYSANPYLSIYSISALKFHRGHNNFIFLCAILSLLCFIYVFVSYLSSREDTKLPRILSAYGRYSLMIYVGHQFIFQLLPNLFGIKNSFHAIPVFIFFILFLVLLYYFIIKYEYLKNRTASYARA